MAGVLIRDLERRGEGQVKVKAKRGMIQLQTIECEQSSETGLD